MLFRKRSAFYAAIVMKTTHIRRRKTCTVCTTSEQADKEANVHTYPTSRYLHCILLCYLKWPRLTKGWLVEGDRDIRVETTVDEIVRSSREEVPKLTRVALVVALVNKDDRRLVVLEHFSHLHMRPLHPCSLERVATILN